MRRRSRTANGGRPLADVLLRTPGDFAPADPDRAPWQQPSLDWTRVDFAVTDNRVRVNLAVADRVQLVGLGRPSSNATIWSRSTWTPAGWGVSV